MYTRYVHTRQQLHTLWWKCASAFHASAPIAVGGEAVDDAKDFDDDAIRVLVAAFARAYSLWFVQLDELRIGSAPSLGFSVHSDHGVLQIVFGLVTVPLTFSGVHYRPKASLCIYSASVQRSELTSDSTKCLVSMSDMAVASLT